MKYLISIKRLLPNGTLCFLRGLAISLLISLPALAQTASATVTYFHNDISGSPMLATDAAGNQVWKESYRPYGQKLRDEPASRDGKNKIGFAGSPFDASTGLSYMGARYYDPVIGRFMGVDPVGFQEGNVHSFNRYAYANNNPYRYIDPDGRQSMDIHYNVWNRAFNTNRLFAPADGAVGFEGAKQGIVQGLIEGAKLSAEVGMTVSPLGVARGVREAVHLNIGTSLSVAERAVMKDIWKGNATLDSLSVSAREAAAKVFDQTANKVGQYEAATAFNKARAAFLRGNGENPGVTARAYAEKHEIPLPGKGVEP